MKSAGITQVSAARQCTPKRREGSCNPWLLGAASTPIARTAGSSWFMRGVFPCGPAFYQSVIDNHHQPTRPPDNPLQQSIRPSLLSASRDIADSLASSGQVGLTNSQMSLLLHGPSTIATLKLRQNLDICS